MCNALAHRGPDDEAFTRTVRSGSVTGGEHPRPVVRQGHQRWRTTMAACGSSSNGEITISSSCDRRSRAPACDSAREPTPRCCYDSTSAARACVSELRGMFAFAIWDERQRTLLLARDRLASSAVLRTGPESLVFASELKALLRVPRSSARWTRCHPPLPELPVRAARSALPRHPQAATRARARVPGREDPAASLLAAVVPPKRRVVTAGEQRTRGGVIERLTDAVRCRLVSDVPLGAFLSGGVDSVPSSRCEPAGAVTGEDVLIGSASARTTSACRARSRPGISAPTHEYVWVECVRSGPELVRH